MTLPESLSFSDHDVDPPKEVHEDIIYDDERPVLDNDGKLHFKGVEQILREIFKPRYTTMVYVENYSKDGKKNSEDTGEALGIGKSFTVVGLLWKLLQIDEQYEVITNIQFAEYRGNGRWKRKMPRRMHYADNDLDLFEIASLIRKGNPDKRIIAAIDELPSSMSQHKSSSEEADSFQEILHLHRKMFIHFIGSGPKEMHFVKAFRDMKVFSITKSLRKVLELRRQGYRASDGRELESENTFFVNANLGRGYVDEWFEIGYCPWTRLNPSKGVEPVKGQIYFETYQEASFKFTSTFRKNFWKLKRILNSKDVCSYEQARIAHITYNFIRRLKDDRVRKKEMSNKRELLENTVKYYLKFCSDKEYVKGVVKGMKAKKDIEFSDAFFARVLGLKKKEFYRIRDRILDLEL